MEATGTIHFVASDGSELTVTGITDSTDPYSWTPSNATALYAFANIVGGLSDRSLTITFNDNAPIAPSADAGDDQNVAPSVTVTLDGTDSSDPDGSIASYSWTRISGPSVALSGANTSTPSFTAPTTSGTIVFQLTITDDDGETDTDTVTISILAPPTIVVTATPTTVPGHLNQLEIVSLSAPFFNLLNSNWSPATSYPTDAVYSIQATGANRWRITFNVNLDIPLTRNLYLGISVPSQGLIAFLKVSRGQFHSSFGPTNSITVERPPDQFFPNIAEFLGEDFTFTLYTWITMLESSPVSQLGRIDARTVNGDTSASGGGVLSTNLPFVTQGNSEGLVTRVRVQASRILLTPESGHSFSTNSLWWLVEDFSGIVIAAEELSPTSSGSVNLDLPYQTGTHDFSIGVYDGNLQSLLDARVGGWDHPASYWS